MASAVEGKVDPGAALGRIIAHLEHHPDDDASWAFAAEALLRLERPDEAVEAARKAQRPGRPERLALLAWALAASGQAREARSWLTELMVDVSSAVAWDRAARAHEHLGEVSAAIAAHLRAVELAPSDAGLRVRLAVRLERAGELARAGDVIQGVLQARPGWAPARRVGVRLRCREGDLDGAASEARLLLEEKELGAEAASGLMLELARIEAGRGNPAAAMAWGTRGNDASLASWIARGGDPDALWRELDALSRAKRTRLPRSSRDETAPRGLRAGFVVGFPRSGTTLVQQMIGAHPAVVAFDEQPLVDRALEEVFPRGSLVDAARGVTDPAVAARFRAAWWRGALSRIGGRPRHPMLLLDKLPLNLLRLDVLVRAFPDAPFLLVVRDPRDSVLSAFLQDFRINDAMAPLTDLGLAARLYDRAMRTWRRAAPPGGIELSYESLVDDPQGTWRPVVERLGLLWDAAVLGLPAAANINTPSYAAVREPLHRRSVGRYRPYVPWLGEAMPLLEPWVKHFGYAR